jgi:hypothetical protein
MLLGALPQTLIGWEIPRAFTECLSVRFSNPNFHIFLLYIQLKPFRLSPHQFIAPVNLSTLADTALVDFRTVAVGSVLNLSSRAHSA